MADAGKLSIGQLQQAVKNGTIPAYIGIPMMQEKMKQAKQAQPTQALAEPPIAQQVMAEASGIDQMPSNLPTQSMNDGGIVAFADEGLVEEDTEEDRQDAANVAEYQDVLGNFIKQQQMSRQSELNRPDTINRTPEINSGFSLSREATDAGLSLGQNPNIRQEDRTAALNRTGDFAVPQSSPRTTSQQAPQGGIKSIVESAANRYGLPPELLYRLTGAESGYDPKAKNTLSGASGLFQFLPSTWEGMGGKPGEETNPIKNADLGAKFVRQNTEILKRELGRNPTFGEVYASHHFGSGVIPMLKNAQPNDSIERGLSMFESPSRVKLIMEQNPHLQGKTVGQVMALLNQKMGAGVVSGANGGIARLNSGGVARFAEDGLVETQRAKDAERNVAPSSIGTLSGEERDKYIANLPTTTQQSRTPAGRFLFDETPEQKKYRTSRQNALNDRNRIMNNFNVNPFSEQSKEEYENAQKAIEQANRNVAEADRGGGYTPPDPYGSGYEPAAMAAAPVIKPAESFEGNNQPFKYSGVTEETGPTITGVDRLLTNTPAAQRNQYDDFIAEMRQEKANSKKQREEDKYMALISAGLGMMGGTSPNALANIGQGAQQGVASYSTSAKQRAAENAALNKNIAAAHHYRSMENVGLAGQNLREREHAANLDWKKTAHADNIELKTTNQLQTAFDRGSKQNEEIRKHWDIVAITADPKGWEKAQKEMAENKISLANIHKILNQKMKKDNPELFASTQPSGDRKPITAWD